MTNYTTDSHEHCPYCGSIQFIQKTNTGGIHWGEMVCVRCNKHIKWLADPSITRKFDERSQIIDKALSSGFVSGWELMFLNCIRDRRHLTPKQKQKFEQICLRHGIGSVNC